MAGNGFGTKFINNLSSFHKKIILITPFSKDLSQKEAGWFILRQHGKILFEMSTKINSITNFGVCVIWGL